MSNLERNTFPQAGDPDDAVRFAQLVGHDVLTDYVRSGLTCSADFVSGELTVSGGVAYVGAPSGTTSSDQIDLENLGYVIQLSDTTEEIPDTGTHYVVVNGNIGTVDSPSIEIYGDSSNAPDWSVEIAVVDVDAESLIETNRNPSATFDSLEVIDDLDFGENSVATLNSVGKLKSSQVPDLSITETTVVPDKDSRLALSDVLEGDVAIQQDTEESYIFLGGDPSIEEDWQLLKSAPAPFQSESDIDHDATSNRTHTGDTLTPDTVDAQTDLMVGNVSVATDEDLSGHESTTTGVHGVGTADVESTDGAQSKADTAQDNAESYADDQVADHETTGEHSQIDGDVVDRVEPIDSLSGNIYVTEEGATDPTQNDGDLWFEYEVTE